MKWSVEEFDASAWDALNDAAGGPALNSGHPALHSINVQLLLKHFGTGEESVWVCRRGRIPVAMVVLTGRLVANAWHPDNQTVALWVQRDDVDFADLARLLARRGLMLSVTHIDPDMLKRPDGHEPVECIETVNYIETARTVVSGSFEDYWQPFTLGAGPAPGYCVSLPEDKRAALKARLKQDVGGDGPVSFVARAWALKAHA